MLWAWLGLRTQGQVSLVPSSSFSRLMIHREHIFRRHQRPTVHCTRYLISFDDEEQLNQHLRAQTRCENMTGPITKETTYITRTQERALRKRKKNVPEEERWLTVFRIVFPDIPTDRPPTPCKSISIELPADKKHLLIYTTNRLRVFWECTS